MSFLGKPSVQGALTAAFTLAAGNTYDCGSPGICFALACCAILAFCALSISYLDGKCTSGYDYSPRRRQD